MDRLINYLKGTRAELKQVNWPTKKQTVNFTMLVIGVSGAVAIFLSFFDQIFTFLLNTFVL